MLSKLSPKLEGSGAAVELAVEPPVLESPVFELSVLELTALVPPSPPVWEPLTRTVSPSAHEACAASRRSGTSPRALLPLQAFDPLAKERDRGLVTVLDAQGGHRLDFVLFIAKQSAVQHTLVGLSRHNADAGNPGASFGAPVDDVLE